LKYEWNISFSKKEFLERLDKACTEERRLERNDYIWGPYLKYDLKKGKFRLYFIQYPTLGSYGQGNMGRLYGKVVNEAKGTGALVKGEFRELKIMLRQMSIFAIAGTFLIFNGDYIFGLYSLTIIGIITIVFMKFIPKACKESHERLLDLINYVIEMQKRE